MCDTARIAKIVEDRMLVVHNEFKHIKEALTDIKQSFEKLNCQRYNEVQINLKNKLLLFKQDIELHKGQTAKDIENIAKSVRKSKSNIRSKVWSIILLVVNGSLSAAIAFLILYSRGQ